MRAHLLVFADGLPMLGLQIGHNTLVPPDPSWVHAFEQERGRLAPALAGLSADIEHYGSTSIAGLKAKPIIDILVGIDALADWMRCREPLRRLGYTYFAAAGVAGHHVFTRGLTASDRTHLLHVVERGSSHWCLNLAFRYRLRHDAELRADYEAAKERAAAAAPCDRLAYNALKGSFIKAVMGDLNLRNELV